MSMLSFTATTAARSSKTSISIAPTSSIISARPCSTFGTTTSAAPARTAATKSPSPSRSSPSGSDQWPVISDQFSRPALLLLFWAPITGHLSLLPEDRSPHSHSSARVAGPRRKVWLSWIYQARSSPAMLRPDDDRRPDLSRDHGQRLGTGAPAGRNGPGRRYHAGPFNGAGHVQLLGETGRRAR